MVLSAAVAFCLLAAAFAAPEDLVNLQCATSCNMSRHSFRGDIGKTYTGSYSVQSIIKIVGVEDAQTQISQYGNVYFSRINPCEVIMKFNDSDETANVNKYPMVFSLFENDIFDKICAHPDDDAESVNIKKGLASQIQSFLPSYEPTAKKTYTEKTILGTCPVTYSVENNGETITVKKQVIHSECTDHTYSPFAIPPVLSASPVPVQVSKSECEQVLFASNKIPYRVRCKDIKVIRPFFGTYKYIEALQESTLQFISESSDIPIYSSIRGVKLVTKKWSYDHSLTAEKPKLVLSQNPECA